MSKWLKWWYHDADGRAVFQHYRVEDRNHPRGKKYGYRYPTAVVEGVVQGWHYGKHPLADTLIYRLPLVLAHRHRLLYTTEGERDADELLQRGVLATCVHGGAGKWTQEQAAWLAGHRATVVLLSDNDPPGAYDVCQRYDLLRAVGVPARRLVVGEVAPTHSGADLRDHLEAGYTLKELRRADLGRLRKVAANVTPANFAAEGYEDWPTSEQLKNWRPTRERRSS